LDNPQAVVLDSSGNLFIADTNNNVIRKVNAQTNIITTYAGGGGCGTQQNQTYCGDGGPATSAELYHPIGLAFDKSGDLYIADTGNNVVRKVNLTTNIITTVAGDGTPGFSGNGGLATSAELYQPASITFDSSWNLYIADTYNNRVRKVTESTGIISTFAGGGSGCTQQSDGLGDGCPAALAVLSHPAWLSFDPTGDLFLADQGYRVIREVKVTGVIESFAGQASAGCTDPVDDLGDGCQAFQVGFNILNAIQFDHSGNLYVSSGRYNNNPQVIQVISASTGIISLAVGNSEASGGPGGAGYTGNGGPANLATVYSPWGMAFDSSGNLYFADSGNNVIRKVTMSAVTDSPTFSPAGGTYSASLSVTLKDSTEGAVIYYTTNGTTPTTSSPQYIGAIPVSETTKIEAFAKAPDIEASPVVSSNYTVTITPTAAAPVFSPDAETYIKSVSVTLSDTTKGATIHYTTNGSTPTATSTKYTAAIPITATETIKAIAIATGFNNSAVSSATYTIDSGITATPTFSLAAGTYGAEELVSLADTTTGAVLYYTTNGATPTTASTKYTTPIAVSTTETIKAIAVAPKDEQSAVASAAYTLVGTASVLTAPATSIGTTGATLNALVAPGGVAATFNFQYGTSSTALTSNTPQMSLSATSSRVNLSSALTGLKSKTKYYFRAVVTTVGGSASSAIVSFTTN
jgi:sugar lactone lactonase YvrE